MIRKWSEMKPVTTSTELFHGRHGETPYGGEGIYLTPDREYAKIYAGSEPLYVYKLNVPTSKIFSFKRSRDVATIRPYFPASHWQSLLSNLNQGEMDWAGVGDLANSEWETTEEFLTAMGYVGMFVTERTGIYSIYLFDINDATFIRREP